MIENVFYGISFSPDGSRIFYTVVDDSWRPYQVKSHVLGTPVGEDEVIYQEDDVAMWLGFELSADRRHLVLSIGCSEFSETRLLRFDDPDAGLRTVISRDERILYEAEPFLLADASGGAGSGSCSRTTRTPSIPWSRSWTRPSSQSRSPSSTGTPSSPIPTRSGSTAPASRRPTRWSPSARTPLNGCRSCPWPDWAPRSRAPPWSLPSTEELYTAGVAGSDYEAPVIRMGYTSYFTPSRVYDFVLPTPELPGR